MIPRDIDFGVVGHGNDPDDAQRGMVIRVRDLALERLEAPPEDIGLGGLQPRRQPVQALLLGRAQVDLNRLRDAPRRS
ncbi:MAG: hypothetical protein OXU64_08300 [Gemmatimonadota bacterium]|nr:hypothetical protein [Gemmatimonadota bacterium]